MTQPAKFDIPKGLLDFASNLTGDYESRYALILDEAFLRHQMLLTGHMLRMIAGGGSNPVAQAALGRWRERLHGLVEQRIEAGSEIPAHLTAKFSQAFADLWALSTTEARSLADARILIFQEEAATQKTFFNEQIEKAQREHENLVLGFRKENSDLRDALVQLNREYSVLQSTSRATQHDLKSALDNLSQVQSLLDNERTRTEAQNAVWLERQRRAENDIKTHAEMAENAQAELRLCREQIAAIELRSTEALISEQNASRTEREEMRRAHFLELDRLRTELQREKKLAQQSIAEQAGKAKSQLLALEAKHQEQIAGHASQLRERDETILRLSKELEQQLGLVDGLKAALTLLKPRSEP